MTTWAFLGGGLSGGEIFVIALLALLLFGNRLPQVMRSLGKGVTEFKKGVKGIESDIEKADIPPPQQLPDNQAKQDVKSSASDKAPA